MALHVLHQPNRLGQLATAIDEHDAVLLVDDALQQYLVSGPETIANLPCPAYALIGGLRAFRYDRLTRWVGRGAGRSVPVQVLYGCGDEFYPSHAGIEAGLGEAFERAEVEVLEDENSHEWLMFRPERTVDALAAFLGGLG